MYIPHLKISIFNAASCNHVSESILAKKYVKITDMSRFISRGAKILYKYLRFTI